MESLVQGLNNLKFRQKYRDDDSVDQLHHFVTVALLTLAGFLIGLKEFAGEPLDCWVELNNWKHFQSHVNSYCWTTKMYKFPNPLNLTETPYPIKVGLGGPEDIYTGKDLGQINFYRWITILFFVQAFLFKLPALIWTACNEYSGTKVEKMISTVSDLTFEAKKERDTMLDTVAEYLEMWLKINRNPSLFMNNRIGQSARKVLRCCMLCVGNNKGNFVSTMYLIVKFLFLFNVLMQFFILTVFLKFDFWSYGHQALSNGDTSEHFPHVGLCHFQMKDMGNWVQCILSINMMLEKIFIVEWFWLLFLLVLTIFSFTIWCCRMFMTQLSILFVKKYLRVLTDDGNPPSVGSKTCSMFVMNYLGNDGVFVLRILATNTNDVAMAELISCIWNRYVKYENKTKSEDEDEDEDSTVRHRKAHSKKGEGDALEMEPMEKKDIV